MSIKMVCHRAGCWVGVVGLFFAVILLAGCGGHPTHQPPSNTPGAASGPPPGGSSETIRVGDSLLVAFADLPSTVAPFDLNVKEDGTITLLLNQTFTVTNKTPGEVEREIRDRYVPKYFKYMTVTVKPSTQTRFYYVGGEVKAPGRQVYLGPITVTKAIQTCGDFSEFAKKTTVKLTRVDGTTQTVNCKKALKDPRLDPQVYPGDKITVLRRFW